MESLSVIRGHKWFI